MTFSLAGRCERSGMLGIAIASSSICVASRCAFVEAGAGAVLTQNVTDPRLGAVGLARLREGYGARAVVDELVRAGAHPEYRQLACVDRDGGSAAFSGAKALGAHGEATGRDFAAAGNLLASRAVVDAMAEAFRAGAREHLADRLVRALAAGKGAGGEVGRNERSAGLLVCHREPFPLVDLRVDWDESDPIARLADLWARFRPQMDAFVLRATRPTEAPPFDPTR